MTMFNKNLKVKNVLIVCAISVLVLFPIADALAAVPDTPVNISPADDALGVTFEDSLTVSAYNHPDGYIHSKTNWAFFEIDEVGTRINAKPIYDTGSSELTTVPVSAMKYRNTLEYGKSYEWEVSFGTRGEDGVTMEWSVYSLPTKFRMNTRPETPTNTYPTWSHPSYGSIKSDATLSASDFSDENIGDTHNASKWTLQGGHAPGSVDLQCIQEVDSSSGYLTAIPFSEFNACIGSYEKNNYCFTVEYQDK